MKNSSINYFKASAAGNTFLLFDFIDYHYDKIPLLKESIQYTLFEENCDSALIIIENKSENKSQSHEYRMIVLERDGSISEFCGNGARVLAQYLSTRFLKNKFYLVSRVGLHAIQASQGYYSVDMGRVRFDLNRRYINFEIDRVNMFYAEAVEPHLIIINSSLGLKNLVEIGNILTQKREYFPRGINVNLVRILDSNTIWVDTFERGVNGLTKSCGTGATSAAALCRHEAMINSDRISVKSLGGQQIVQFLEDGRAILEGGANIIDESKPLLKIKGSSNSWPMECHLATGLAT